MHSKVAMQCGPATGGTSHNVWDVVLYNPKGRAFSSRISWAVSIHACQHAVFPDDWCYSPIWCWSQRLERSSLSLVSNATLAIEQPSQGTLGNAIPTFNPDFGRQVWHRSTSASSLWSTQQKALLRRLPVRLSSELETTRSENIFSKKEYPKTRLCVWLRVSCMRLLRRPRCSKTTLHSRLLERHYHGSAGPLGQIKGLQPLQ